MNARLHSSRGGFTLFEVIITLTIFVMLCAAVFEIFSATLESAAGLQDNQNRHDQAEALGAWLKQKLLTLPASGLLVSYHREGRPFHVSGIIWGAGDDLQALDLQPQANGNYTLRLAAYQPGNSPQTANPIGGPGNYSAALATFQTQVFNDDSGLAWRPLMRDLKSADWRFRLPNIPEWQDVSTGNKPVLAQFTFQEGGASSAIVDDFWIPQLQPAINPALVIPPVNVSANP